MTTTTIKTSGMHCNSCEMLVKDSLEELPSVTVEEISHESGDIVIRFDPQETDIDTIRRTIEQEGYGVL